MLQVDDFFAMSFISLYADTEVKLQSYCQRERGRELAFHFFNSFVEKMKLQEKGKTTCTTDDNNNNNNNCNSKAPLKILQQYLYLKFSFETISKGPEPLI